jgi:hypothetical protein
MEVIEKLRRYVDINYHDEAKDALHEKIDDYVKQIKGESDETFARKKFIVAMRNSVGSTKEKNEIDLITNQMPNSEMIRTNGNEFLIYLVGYDEKQIASYIKKLNKDFKDLSHGFGAAMGYSMITDEIKTIDDAVNEATLDMRNNKEELNN